MHGSISHTTLSFLGLKCLYRLIAHILRRWIKDLMLKLWQVEVC